MAGQPLDEVIGELLKKLNKGQYILLVEAIRQLGGEIRVDPGQYSRMLVADTPRMNVLMEDDGSLVLRVMP